MESTKSKKDASTKEAAAPAPAEEKRRPITTLRLGDVSASIWARDRVVKGETVRFYSVSFEKSYQDAQGKYRYVRSFDPDDLGALMALCQQAGDYINGQKSLVRVTDRD